MLALLVGAAVAASPQLVLGASASVRVGAQQAKPGPRQITFVNRMQQTIWVAATPGTAPDQLSTTGWVLAPGGRKTIVVPDRYNGRFWGRTGCHFNAAGRGHCATGDCAGLFQCQVSGQIPATLAEYNLDSWDSLDFYDVSMVDGSNLPMYINSFGGTSKDRIDLDGCSAAGCTRAVVCPPVLQVRVGGQVVGCISACAHFGTDQYCCRGKWSSRAACNPSKWPVDYAAVFKRAEPFAYSYVYDDATSTFTCYGRCNYWITFGLSPAGATYR